MSGNVIHSKSDHLIQFGTLKDFIKPSSLCKSSIYKPNFKNFDRNKLKEDFQKINWDKVTHKNDKNINGGFNSFYKTLAEVIHTHVPLIKITIKAQTFHLKPQIKKKKSNISNGKETNCFESIAPVKIQYKKYNT